MATHRRRTEATRKTYGLTAALALLAGAPAGLAQDDPFALGGQGGQVIPGQQGEEPAIRDPLDQGSLDLDGTVTVNEHNIVDLHVADERLANVLQMLSLQTQKNIITSQNVSASITATLYGVTFYEALDAILHVNGYGYIEEGNFIYVYTVDELIEIEKANRKRVSQVIHLDYLNAVDAAEFATPFLSETGQIKSPGATEDFNIPGTGPVGADDYALDSMIVVIDFEDNVAQITSMIEEIDTRPSQVLVEATILQSAVTEANAFGIDFSILGSLDFEDFAGIGGPLQAADALIGGVGETVGGDEVALPRDGYGSVGTSTVGNTNGPASFKAGVVSGDFAVFLRMLDEVTDTTVLSRPKLLTLNRQPARVLVGRKVGYLSTTTTDTSSTQTVEFLDTGTQLYLRPFVSRDGMIRMELKPQVSEAVIRSSTDTTGGTVTIPDEITNEIVANVMVRDGQTIVLGGLFRENTTASRRQVPFLGDLPVIGAAFRGNDDSVDRQEIIFMVTPTIVNDEILIEQAARGEEFVDHARTGAREGLLPWSREKRSAQLLVDARRDAANGRVKQAQYKVRRSLGLNPYQPDAYEMLESLGGKVKSWPERSILHEIMRGEVEAELSAATGKVDDEHLAAHRTAGTSTPTKPRVIELAPQTPAPKTPADEAGDAGVVTTVPEELEGASAGGQEAPGSRPFDQAPGAPAQAASAAVAEAAKEDPTDAASHAEQRQLSPAPVALAPIDELQSMVERELAEAAEAAPQEMAAREQAAREAAAQAELPRAAAAAPEPTPERVTADLEYQDVPMKAVLADLGSKFRRNVVAPRGAEDLVTATLYGVEFEDAMAALLETNGYTWRDEGNLVRVERIQDEAVAGAGPDAGSVGGEGASPVAVAEGPQTGSFGPGSQAPAFSEREQEIEAELAASATLGNLKWMTPSRLTTPRSALDGGSESFQEPADWSDDPEASPSESSKQSMKQIGAAPSREPAMA